MTTIPVAFVLHDNADIELLLEILKSLDFEVTGVGKSTVSGRTSLPQCEKVFNVHITIHKPELPGKYDMGTSGGFSTDKTPTIPKQLEPYVKTVSIVPPLRRL